MSSRLAGAILALTAAALLALSLVTSAWWAGHPEVDGRTIELKTVHVGLHGAEGCNTGGDGGCTALTMPEGFTITGYIELGAAGLLAVGAILLGISTLRGAEGRKALAKIVIGLVLVSAAVAIALIIQGPKMTGSARHVAIPVGFGMFMFWGGGAAAVLGSVLAMRPLPKVELRPSRAAIAPGLAAPPVAHQPVDVLALLQQEEAMRPAALGPEPQMGRAQAVSPGGGLAGPAGPLGFGSGQPAPMFSAAPQLRPLYDSDPSQGGTSGYVPGLQPQLPTRAPTPIPRANISAVAGIPTPAPFTAPEQPRPITTQGAAVVPNAPPPPPRMKSASVAPPVPGTRPPGAPPPKPQGSPPPPGAIAARLKAASVPPPVRASIPVPTTGPRTLAAAVVPPPTAPVQPMKLPIRAATDPSEHLETVDRDAMTIDRGHDAAVQVGRPAAGEEIGDSTDANIALAPTEASPPLDTEEAPVVPPPPPETDDVDTSAVEKHDAADLAADAPAARAQSELETSAHEKLEAEIGRQSQSEIQTIAREKLSARELLETGDSTSPTTEPAGEQTAMKIPITTAPDSLPPPTEKQAASSGPSPACPQCESPMAWVEEHLRFYCKSCRMYF